MAEQVANEGDAEVCGLSALDAGLLFTFLSISALFYIFGSSDDSVEISIDKVISHALVSLFSAVISTVKRGARCARVAASLASGAEFYCS